MLQTDTVDVTDTMTRLHTTATHAADSLQALAPDTLEQARRLSTLPDTLLGQASSYNASDTLLPANILEGEHWPITLWGDTVTEPQSLYEVLNAHGHPLAYNILHDNLAISILIGCFLLIVLLISFSRNYLKEQFRNFFAPTNNKEEAKPVKKPSQIYTPLIMAFTLCISNGLLLYTIATQQYDVQAGLLGSSTILALCIGCFFAYNTLRWCLYHFVNWIFFNKTGRQSWSTGYLFILTLEGMLFYPITLVALNIGWDVKTTAICIISLYALTRILLFYHSFRVFFPKTYGLLHLFAYLCTLELTPLLFLWKIIEILGNELIVK